MEASLSQVKSSLNPWLDEGGYQVITVTIPFFSLLFYFGNFEKYKNSINKHQELNIPISQNYPFFLSWHICFLFTVFAFILHQWNMNVVCL